MDGSPNAYSRYNPLDSGSIAPWGGQLDPQYQGYQPKKDSLSYFTPGFTLGGPIKKDKLWFFLGFNPWLEKDGRTVDFRQ